MHIPNPLGSYPLVLRDKNTVITPRKGELLLDYTTYDIYYADRETGEIEAISKNIYDKIIAAKLNNTKIEVANESEVPDPINRTVNTFYYVIKDK